MQSVAIPVSQSAFVQEEVEDCVRKVRRAGACIRFPSVSLSARRPLWAQILEGYLTDAVYDDSKVEHWIDIICADSLRELASLQKPFKYIGERQGWHRMHWRRSGTCPPSVPLQCPV